MRRKDREVVDQHEILEIMRRCDVCYVAFGGADTPYVIPMNFGIGEHPDGLSLYFHCAPEGAKLERLRLSDRVGFSMSCGHRLEHPDSCRCTMRYESVCGSGRMRAVDGAEKSVGLTALMAQYHPEPPAEFPQNALDRVCVLRLDVEELTAKRSKSME